MHPIENTVRVTMENLKSLVDVNTIVGKPVLLSDGSVILPVSRVSLGFVSGGGEYDTKHPVKRSGEELDQAGSTLPFAATAAVGMGLMPVSFLTIKDGRVSVLPAESCGPLGRVVEMIPQMLNTAERLIRTLSERKKSEQ